MANDLRESRVTRPSAPPSAGETCPGVKRTEETLSSLHRLMRTSARRRVTSARWTTPWVFAFAGCIANLQASRRSGASARERDRPPSALTDAERVVDDVGRPAKLNCSGSPARSGSAERVTASRWPSPFLRHSGGVGTDHHTSARPEPAPLAAREERLLAEDGMILTQPISRLQSIRSLSAPKCKENKDNG